MITLQLTRGSSRDFLLQANNPDGTPATNIFLSSDTLSTNVWSGDGTTVLLNLANGTGTTWVSATNGTFQITFNNADTATTWALAPTISVTTDTYRIQTTATRGGAIGRPFGWSTTDHVGAWHVNSHGSCYSGLSSDLWRYFPFQ